jgi:PAS domain S-box-containing protein
MQKSIYLGDGLVGTCAVEKQIINLTEIPEGYIKITSGLGDAKPDNLLLVPVLHELDLIGVLEIASLTLFKEHEIQFAGEVARSLGATIIYARNNQRTSGLLAKSQQQALEMAEQEEEMRQNMEELKATQEESSRREEEFRGIAEAIGQSLFVIEYGLDGIIREVNDKFCIFMGVTREEIIGKEHPMVIAGSLKPDTLFWEELQKNNHITLIEKVKIGKKQYHLKEHFAVVPNKDGIVVKYINFITDVTT